MPEPMCTNLYTVHTYLWMCCIHFHFATNEPKNLCALDFLRIRIPHIPRTHTLIYLHPPPPKKHSQRLKESKEFLYHSSSSSVKFQHSKLRRQLDRFFQLNVSGVCVCEWGKNFVTCLNSSSSSRSTRDNNNNSQRAVSRASENASEIGEKKFLQINSEICDETIYMHYIERSKKNA